MGMLGICILFMGSVCYSFRCPMVECYTSITAILRTVELYSMLLKGRVTQTSELIMYSKN